MQGDEPGSSQPPALLPRLTAGTLPQSSCAQDPNLVGDERLQKFNRVTQ